MADKDMGERNMLKDELPSASLQICLFHVLRTFKREVTCEKLKISVDERLHMLKILQKIAYCKSDQAYQVIQELYKELQDANILQ
jgi:zinc finger SWIM domain-containing protein 3